MKVAATCLQWSPLSVPHSPSTNQTLASAMSSPSSKTRSGRNDGALLCRYMHSLNRSSLFGTTPTTLCRARSYEFPKPRACTIIRACSRSLDAFSDEDFSKKIQELALRLQLSKDDDNSSNSAEYAETSLNSSEFESENFGQLGRIDTNANDIPPIVETWDPQWLEIHEDLPVWRATDGIVPAGIERKANSVEIPLSLRIIKRKKQCQVGFREASESAYCSVKKAFSSMVFIIRELYSYTLQMREHLFYEDLQGIWASVRTEMHASFVWLFQRVFSQTPTLMVYVMILLANFTIHSMSNNAAIAASPIQSDFRPTAMESVSVIEDDKSTQRFDSSMTKSFVVKSSGRRTTSIGGNNGGGDHVRPVASGTEGDGWLDQSGNHHRSIVPDGGSQVSTFKSREDQSVSVQYETEEEGRIWNSIVEEASRMQTQLRDEALDHETVQRFVSPLAAKIEDDDYADYRKTEFVYLTGLTREPNDPLLLANYAQFLQLVLHDYDRAEEYFKRAIAVEPKDAEACIKYANFLWQVRKDMWAAEETFLEAISADPSNPFHAASYAHFLWGTGGEDTCFPLSPPDALLDA
ncbi:hypothetical protein Nepgr_014073 [Nepenthes gracilis]|uniref:Uncharacterized protein n=1 Tax=Nepenthes gracilis TaxID=150966 RepID=A0AAD3SJE4_NEPGR|nr:hypothetical protein Nepgr_014073 [Nepenthes gracilis]